MKHAKYILVSLGIVFIAAWEVYDWVFVDDGPSYFAEDWRRVLFVVAIGVIGGCITLLFLRLPTQIRFIIAEYMFGGIGLLAIIGSGYSLWLLLQMRWFFAEAGISIWRIAGTKFLPDVILVGLAVGFFYYFHKKRLINSQQSDAQNERQIRSF